MNSRRSISLKTPERNKTFRVTSALRASMRKGKLWFEYKVKAQLGPAGTTYFIINIFAHHPEVPLKSVVVINLGAILVARSPYV
jgi:hypothetical protein